MKASNILDTIGRVASGGGMLLPGRAGSVVSAVGEGLRLVGAIVDGFDAPDIEVIRIRASTAERIRAQREYAEKARRN